MSAMAYNYVVTAQKPTCVSHSLAGNFTSPTDRNLIIGKCTLMEIHKITEEGVQPIVEVPIYGRISCLETFKPPNEKQDYLFLMTETFGTCILRYNEETNEIETVAAGSVNESTARVVESGFSSIIDPLCRMIALKIYEGTLKIIPLNFNTKYTTSEAFNVRIEESNIWDLVSLETGIESMPVLAVLYEDSKHARHVKTYSVSMMDKELNRGPWEQLNVDRGANILIPVPAPLGGVIILGESTITYHNGVYFVATSLPTPTLFCSYEKVDATRYLLGDNCGILYVLQIVFNQKTNRVASLEIESIGTTSISSSITYIDNGYTFIGSTYGDSQLIRLQDTRDSEGNMFEIFMSYTNLGSILDFCVFDPDKQGQDQIVTCSGGFRDCTLRIIRNGIGIDEIASINFPGINGIWSIRHEAYDRYIIVTFLTGTRALGFDSQDELGNVDIEGLEINKKTIVCESVSNHIFVQVTDTSIRLINTESLKLIDEWMLNEKILHASISPTQVVCSTGGNKLHYLEIEHGKLKKLKSITMSNEIASLDIHPLGDNTTSYLCAVGMWTEFTLKLLTLPDLSQIYEYKLPASVLPRSVIFCTLEGINYLLCGLGDGQLLSFRINIINGELLEGKKVSLGTKPIGLTLFTSRDNSKHIFASSDRPAVIYSSNQKLLYSNVNLKDANFMCPFKSQLFPDCLAIAREDSLFIGSIDEIQKLHIRTVALGEQATRICYHESSKSLVLSMSRFTEDMKSSIEMQSHFLLLINAQSFVRVNEFALEKEEIALSLLPIRFDGDEKEYVAVGTGYTLPDEPMPKKGRILIFDIRQEENGKQFLLVAERDIKGGAYALTAFSNGKLLAGVNGSLILYRWNEGDDGNKELTIENQIRNRIYTMSLQSIGDFIVSGDVMKSVAVFQYKQPEGTIEEVARDNNFFWICDTELINQDIYIGAENEYNLFTLQRNNTSENEEVRRTLEVVGRYHIGDLVTRFRHGSLVMRTHSKRHNDEMEIDMEEISAKKKEKMQETDYTAEVLEQLSKPILFSTVSGSIGIIAQLTKEQFDYFSKLQDAMNCVIKGVGNFKHETFRAFKSERMIELPVMNFLDGDLIESFLDLKKDRQVQVSNEMNRLTKRDELSSVDEIVKRIEEFAISLH